MKNNAKPSGCGLWIGVGAKGGGTAVAAGLEDMEGVIYSLVNPNLSYGFGISGFRLGLGLGMSAGITTVVAFDCTHISHFDGQSSNDWGFNFSLGGKWSSIVKGLTQFKFFKIAGELFTMGGGLPPQHWEDLRNSLSYLYSALDAKSSGAPKMLAIDVPGVGVGTEISLHYTWSKFRLYEGVLQSAERQIKDAMSRATQR